MGYQVGRICYETKEAATDVLMSQTPPAIRQDGTLVYPVKSGDSWTYSGHAVNLSLPECNPNEYFQAGMQISTAVIGLLGLMYAISLIRKFINRINSDDGDE